MKITTTGTVKTGGDVSRKKSSSSASGDFGKILESELSETKESQNVAPAKSIDAILAVQQVNDEELSRKKAISYGHDLLDGLERLRNQLLMGEVSFTQLKNIEKLMQNYRKDSFTDPALTSIIDEIETRVAVEIAKFEKYT